MKSSTQLRVTIVLELLIATITFAACSTANNTIATTVDVNPTGSTLPVSTATLKGASRPTNTGIIDADRTATFMPSPASTWTPLPSVAKEKLSETIHSYLIENGGCNFPCWWGIEPGRTDWRNAVQRFDTLDFQPSSGAKKISVGNSELLEHSKGYLYDDNTTTISWLISGVNEKVSKITISTDNKEQFGFSPILKNIGPPDQIYLKTFQDVPGYPDFEPFIPFSVVLHYESEHMVIWYQMQGQKDGVNIIACNKNYKIYAWIWAKELVEENYENYVLNMAGGGNDGFKYLRVLDNVTTINKEKFTEIFQNNKDGCITTPAGKW